MSAGKLGISHSWVCLEIFDHDRGFSFKNFMGKTLPADSAQALPQLVRLKISREHQF